MPTPACTLNAGNTELLVQFEPLRASTALSALPALNAAGITLQPHRALSLPGTVVYRAGHDLTPVEARQIAAELTARPDVRHAGANAIFETQLVPNDPYFGQGQQWNFTAIRAHDAWNVTTGQFTTSVAVVDTGQVTHPDLMARTLPGFDFVTDTCASNDGDGRDGNPFDPGGDRVRDGHVTSSYHGTHVAGIIGAVTNNREGVAGLNWNAGIVPVRVLGRGGGQMSDVIDAIRWAAGLKVEGVSNNPNPASVINLSLGAQLEEPCSPLLQQAINDASAAGSVVIAAAGNSGTDASRFSPANCARVVVVGATDELGNRAEYSNYGPSVHVMAPGGSSSRGVTSTWFDERTRRNSYSAMAGTSMAAPHVSGVVSLMKGLNPSLSVEDVLAVLQSSPSSRRLDDRKCTGNLNIVLSATDCGSGLLDALDAVQRVP